MRVFDGEDALKAGAEVSRLEEVDFAGEVFGPDRLRDEVPVADGLAAARLAVADALPTALPVPNVSGSGFACLDLAGADAAALDFIAFGLAGLDLAGLDFASSDLLVLEPDASDVAALDSFEPDLLAPDLAGLGFVDLDELVAVCEAGCSGFVTVRRRAWPSPGWAASRAAFDAFSADFGAAAVASIFAGTMPLAALLLPGRLRALLSDGPFDPSIFERVVTAGFASLAAVLVFRALRAGFGFASGAVTSWSVAAALGVGVPDPDASTALPSASAGVAVASPKMTPSSASVPFTGLGSVSA